MLQRVLATVVVLATSSPAWAGSVPLPVPEPESIALLAIGAAAVGIARWLRK